eukprot:4479346-Amphidinium_carterae.1
MHCAEVVVLAHSEPFSSWFHSFLMGSLVHTYRLTLRTRCTLAGLWQPFWLRFAAWEHHANGGT